MICPESANASRIESELQLKLTQWHFKKNLLIFIRDIVMDLLDAGRPKVSTGSARWTGRVKCVNSLY
jgi:hypothetical protein